MAIPPFVFGLILIYVFGYILGWVPTSGSVNVLTEKVLYLTIGINYTILLHLLLRWRFWGRIQSFNIYVQKLLILKPRLC